MKVNQYVYLAGLLSILFEVLVQEIDTKLLVSIFWCRFVSFHNGNACQLIHQIDFIAVNIDHNAQLYPITYDIIRVTRSIN